MNRRGKPRPSEPSAFTNAPRGDLRRAAKAGIISPDWDALARQREPAERTPLLCDQIVNGDALPSMKQDLRQAHRVIFDDAATDHLADVIVSCADLVLEHETFARQPWNPMWVEMRYGQTTHPEDKIGYLFNDHHVAVLFNSGSNTEPVLHPLIYYLHEPWQEGQEAPEGLPPDLEDKFWQKLFLGPHYAEFAPHLRDTIRANYSVRPTPLYDYASMSLDIKLLLDSASGELLRILAILLLLNRPGHVRYDSKPAGRTFVRGKSRPYMSHTVLHFSLDPKESLRALRNEHAKHPERGPLRWHSVRDHYCHSKDWRKHGSIGCIHTPIQTDAHWIPAPELQPLECGHWVCSQCGGRRWRREYPNGRGSAAVGFVQQDMTIVEGPAEHD